MRVLGLDIGLKTCGIALSDELGLLAHGQENFTFSAKDWLTLLNHLAPYFDKYVISKIVVGLPTYPSGEASATTVMIKEVASLIAERFSKEVIFVNENFSTKDALTTLRSQGNSPQKAKAKKDVVAAEIILNDFLTAEQAKTAAINDDDEGEETSREVTVLTEEGKELKGELIFTFEVNGDEFVVYGINEVIYAAKTMEDGSLRAVEADEWDLVEKIINEYLAEHDEELEGV